MEPDKKLAQLVKHAYENSSAFKKRMDEANLSPDDIKSLKDLKKIPVLKKEKLIELQRDLPPFGGILTVDTKNLVRVFLSPGPIFDPQGEGKDYWRWREALEAAGFCKDDIVLNTFSYHLTPAGFMFDDALRAIGATVIPAGVGNTEQQVMIAKALGATGYIGTPSFLYTILKKAEEMGYNPGNFSLKVAFVAAEKLPESLRETFEEKWGIKTRQGYGTADLGAVAFECDQKEGMHITEGVIVEIVDPETGEPLEPEETGEIVVTLLDFIYPLIRFGTGDLSQMIDAPCACGRKSPRIVGILGRIGDAIKMRGIFVYPHQVKEIADEYVEIERVHCTVTRHEERDFLTMEIALKDPSASKIIDELKQKARDKLKVRIDKVKIVPLEKIKGKPLLQDLRKWG